MHTQIIIFHDNDNGCNESAYDTVNRQCREWFREHPEAIYVTSHSTALKGNYGEGPWTEFSLTLVVNVPDVATIQQPEDTSDEVAMQLLAYAKNHRDHFGREY